MRVHELVDDEAVRRREFPVVAERIFLAHAGVTALPRVAIEALRAYGELAGEDSQENDWVWKRVGAARAAAARLVGCSADEIALLGPTALGLSLVANGIPWEPGDEVVYYADDYPANVYPWLSLRERGVNPVPLRTEAPGVITWDVIEPLLTDRTRLVALASCHFLSGYRIDIAHIGRKLHERGILFCLDGIQTLGAFDTTVEHVDFLSADSHKWMLGPCGAGIFYVNAAHHGFLRPTLLGSWNVYSPDFVAQDSIRYYAGARRYEPGSLNMPGILAMAASLELILDAGIEAIENRLLLLRQVFLEAVRPLGYRQIIEDIDAASSAGDTQRSCIISLTHASKDLGKVYGHLLDRGVRLSLRKDRAGRSFLRFSPHFYNTIAELDHVAALLA